MFNFIKRLFGINQAQSKQHNPQDRQTTDTFLEATDGGWYDSPEVIADDGGSQKGYVADQLELARQQAIDQSIKVGDKFTYKLTGIPVGIEGPHEIMLGMMIQAPKYGLMPSTIHDEEVEFTRLS